MRNESSYDLANHINKMAVSTALAGVRQRNIFGIYMENYSTYKDAIVESEKAQGSAARKMEAYNESVAYSINQLTTAWEGFTQKLEASGAVKLFFNALTDLIENLGTRLSQVVSLIVSMRSFKLTTDLKRLADFFGFEGTGTGRIKTGVKNIWGAVTGKNEVDKAASEVEKYEQQKAGTYEEQSRNKVVSSNNRVVGALNRNTDALDRNSAAQKGEKVSQTGGDKPIAEPSAKQAAESVEPTSKIPRKWWLGFTGSTVSTSDAEKALEEARDNLNKAEAKLKIEEEKQFDDWSSGIYSEGEEQTSYDDARNAKTLAEAKYSVANENYSKIQKQRTEELKATKARWKQTAIRGVGTGLTAGIIAGMTTEGDVQDKFVTGASTAIMTGLFSAIPGVGAILGPILGPVLGSFFGKEINKLLKADEINRKERVEQAKENLEAIKGISTSVTGLIDLQSKIMVNGEADTSLWDADDWKQANEYVDSLNKTTKASDGFKKALTKADVSVNDLGFTIENLIEKQETLAKIESARIAYEAEQTYAAGEQDRYTLLKEIEEAQKTLISGKASEEDKKSAEAKITANKAAIQEYTSELNKAYMKSAFYSSGVSTMSEGEINVASLDRLLMEMAAAAQEKAKDTTGEKFFEDDGTLKSEYRSSFIQDLRERGGYGAVLTDSKKSISDYNDAMGLANKITEKTNESLSDLKDAANTFDSKTGKLKIFEILKDKYKDSEIEGIIDAINNADANKVASIANSFNMTAEQFAKANENGDFDFVTTGMALENLDAFTERVNTLSDALAELAVNGKLSSDSLENIIQNYPFLLQSDGSFSADNILKNLADLYAQGADSPIAQLLAGKFQSEATTSEAWWKAWTQSDIGKQFIEEKPTNTTFKSFAEAMDGMSDEQRESYINYVASLYETDFMEDVRQKLIEWQTKSYENEISNLESIRDSLDDVNKQREKEIELIKAKEALENAYAEKKRVYRAGVGFVYSTDQEAVKTAQEKVDELERQKDKDTIQYQIDSLQQQKEILESIEENEQLKNLEEYVKTISGAFGEGGTLFNSILGQKSGDFMTNMKETIASGISESAKVVTEEENLRATEAAAEAYVDAGTDYTTFTDKNKSILEDKNNPRYAAIYKQWLEKAQALENARSAYSSASGVKALEDDWSYKDKKVSDFNDWNSVKSTDYGSPNLNTKANLLDSSFDWGQFVKTTGATTTAGLILSGGNPFAALLTGGAGAIASAASQIGKATVGADIYIDDETAPKAEGTEEFSDHMIDSDPHIILHYEGAGKGWVPYLGTKGSLDELKKAMTPGDILINDSYWGEDHAVYLAEDGTFRWVNSNSGRIYRNDWEKALNPITDESKYASGVISSAGGPALINENGLESIITPQGTITSLPSKTGIIPADLTRNLWALGEVAPNLIARLGGNGVQTSNNSSSTDNSININNLDAKFYTEEGFDGEAFLRELKKQVILTANNH